MTILKIVIDDDGLWIEDGEGRNKRLVSFPCIFTLQKPPYFRDCKEVYMGDFKAITDIENRTIQSKEETDDD